MPAIRPAVLGCRPFLDANQRRFNYHLSSFYEMSSTASKNKLRREKKCGAVPWSDRGRTSVLSWMRGYVKYTLCGPCTVAHAHAPADFSEADRLCAIIDSGAAAALAKRDRDHNLNGKLLHHPYMNFLEHVAGPLRQSRVAVHSSQHLQRCQPQSAAQPLALGPSSCTASCC